ncbi:MAG: Holliday junction resolvase RuvX [Anaerolineae bacterium]|nr:Holliday junction resolvase RuvX [Anaerolineae bacterium]
MSAGAFPGRLLGVDYGLKVIGLAISDPTGLLARPLDLLRRTSKREDFAHIYTVIATHGAVGLVVGLPESPPHITVYTQADRVRLWASRLAAAVEAPVYLWNERYSTQEAGELLAEAGRERPGRIDAVAAAVILQSFLDARRAGEPWPEPVAPAQE